jgi:hypothetical protein
MGILPILMILHNPNLHKKSAESLPILSSPYMFQSNIDPSFRLRKLEVREGDEVVVAGPSEEGYTGRGVGLVGFEVEVDADGPDAD